MKKIVGWVWVVLFLPNIFIGADSAPQKSALLLIDIQNFYFPGAPYALVNPEKASLNAQKLLKRFREEEKTVIHVRHNAKKLAEIHSHVKPVKGEKVISKDKANGFVGTDLLETLKSRKITHLVICGMMTHMCVEAATRAAADYGFKCTVISDACATRDLKFKDTTISAQMVHLSTLASLSGYYAKVVDTATYLKK